MAILAVRLWIAAKGQGDMSGANPWSVKGIDPKVREAVRDAARRQGMTLGEYLNQALQAHETGKQPGGETALARPRLAQLPQAYQDDSGDDFHWRGEARLVDPVANLAQKIETIERRSQLAITGLDRTMSALDRTMLGLAQRVDDAEAGAADAADKVVDALIQFRQANEALNTSLRGAETQAVEQRRALDEASAAMHDVRAALEQRVEVVEQNARSAEAGVAEIADRIADADAALGARITEIEAQSRTAIEAALAETRAASERVSRAAQSSAEALKDVRAQQETLAQRLVSTEKATRQAVRSAIEETRSSTNTLSDRMERLEQDAQAHTADALGEFRNAQELLAQRILDCENGARTASEKTLEEMREIHAALIERMEGMETNAPSEEALKTIQAALARRIEAAESAAENASAGLRQAAGAAIADLRNAQLALAARVKAVEDAPASAEAQVEAVSELQARVQDLAQRLAANETRGVQDTDALHDQARALEVRLDHAIRSVSERIGENQTAALEANGAVRSIEETVRRLSERLANTESAANSAMLRLEDAISSFGGANGVETEALRVLLEKRLDHLAQATSSTIEDVRQQASDQVAAALAGLRTDEIDSAITDISRRLASAERRQAQTIEAISVEIKRLSETMDRRLRTVETRNSDDAQGAAVREEVERMRSMLEERFADIERREAANFERMGAEIEQVSERVASAEAQSAQSLDQMSDQIARVAKRFNQRQDQMSEELGERIGATEEKLNSVLAEMQERVKRAEVTEAASPPETLAAVADRLNVSSDTPVRARPIQSSPASDDPNAFSAVADDAISFADDENADAKDKAAAPESDAQAKEISDAFPHFGDPEPPASQDAQTADSAPPQAASAMNWRPCTEADFDPFEDRTAPLPSLATDADPKTKTRRDYLAAAQRAALAQAAVEKSSRRGFGLGPISGLRGPGRIVLWGAAGATAIALTGGLWFLKEQPSEGEEAAAPPALGPPSAEASPLPLTTPFNDEAASSDETDASLRENSLAMRAGAGGSAPRPVAGPIGPRNSALERAAAAGNPVAQYDLALQRLAANRAREGIGLLRNAATQGLAMAQYRLAKLYERGEGVPADPAQARQWTERAAASGNRRAMHDLGVFFARGEGAPIDEAAAYRWFRRAALLGVTDSQYNLGILLQQGRGVQTDAAEAMFWFLVAARQGDGDARAQAQAIEAGLARGQAQNVHVRAEAFRPRAANARANGEFGARPWTPVPQRS